MEHLKSVTKFEIDNKTIYIKISWKPNANDLFQIKIYDSENTWSGSFSYETAEEYKDRFDELEEEYNDNVKKGLSKDLNFSYSFTLKSDDNNTAEFKWKKKLEESNAVMKVHGAVLVHRDEIKESKDLLIDELLAENEKLRETIEKVSAEKNDLSTELEKSNRYLNEFSDIKTNLEATLYGKFVQVLAAKKRRIQLLEDSIPKQDN